MQTLMLSLFVVVFSLDYLANIAGMVHPLVTLAPELLSGVATLLLCGHLARTKRFDLHIKYVIFFALFGMHLLNGVIINETPTGAVVAGLRVYLKYLPFFFLPVVYEFTPRQLRVQMLLLLGLLVCQLPITVLQRFVFFPDYATGDVVRGTLTTGSFLSIILVSAISVLLGLYLKRIISGAVFGVLFFLLFLPTTLSETKGTLVLLPLALAVPLLFSSGRARWRSILGIGAVAGLAMTVFVSIYQYTQTEYVGREESIVDFFSDPDRLAHYLAPRTAGIETIDDRYGRVDRVFAALEEISADPFTLLVGFGMGNVTESPIASFSGDRVEYIEQGMLGSTAPYVLLETGILGALFWMALFWMVFQDARRLSRREGMPGALGLGWMGVLAVMAMAVFYKDYAPVNAVMYLFWYFTGTLVAMSASEATATTSTAPLRSSYAALQSNSASSRTLA